MVIYTGNQIKTRGKFDWERFRDDWMAAETGAYFGGGSHIIYANGSYKDDSDPVGKLMYDFKCLSSADMFYLTYWLCTADSFRIFSQFLWVYNYPATQQTERKQAKI